MRLLREAWPVRGDEACEVNLWVWDVPVQTRALACTLLATDPVPEPMVGFVQRQ